MNPNEYDDNAFLEASNAFQSEASVLFTKLWDAGADQRTIIDEINNALAEAGIDNIFGNGPLIVTEGGA